MWLHTFKTESPLGRDRGVQCAVTEEGDTAKTKGEDADELHRVVGDCEANGACAEASQEEEAVDKKDGKWGLRRLSTSRVVAVFLQFGELTDGREVRLV